MTFSPIRKLHVKRTLSTGDSIQVGVLAQNRQGVFFQYDRDYLERFENLSPFTLQANTSLQQAPKAPHQGVHGVFGDSLPDGWGTLLQDRLFRQHNILPSQITTMDRLALVGNQGMGALSFAPRSTFARSEHSDIDIVRLGLQAQKMFDESQPFELSGTPEDVLSTLVSVGSSGGARPKAQIYMPAGELSKCRTFALPNDEAWLVKFTSKNLPLGHEEGLCEAVYLSMANAAKCEPPAWQMIETSHKDSIAWLAVKRFDYLVDHKNKPAGRYHLHSICGLLDADFRSPSLDYEDLIKASRQLCKSPAVGRLQFRRAVFNLFAANQDDHSKNWSFLQMDDGSWQPAPFYDVTFSPNAFNEHATAFGGYGKAPPLKTMQSLAASAGFAKWQEAQQCIEEVLDAISQFGHFAEQQGVSKTTISAIEKILDRRFTDNAGLLKT